MNAQPSAHESVDKLAEAMLAARRAGRVVRRRRFRWPSAEWLQLYTMWLLLAMLAVTTAVLFLHARADRTYTFDGCFAGSAAAEDAVVVTYGEGPICEGEK